MNERELGQRFEIDVEIIADLAEAVAADDMKKTVNYEKVYRLVESEVVNEKYHLLELLRSMDEGPGIPRTEVLARAEENDIERPEWLLEKLIRRGLVYIHDGEVHVT